MAKNPHSSGWLLLLIWFCFYVEIARAADWPTVRGSNFDGHSNEVGLADEWPAEGPPILWVRDLGQGYSAFVAVGSRLFTQAQDLTGQYVYCLDADTGETIWTHRYEWPYEAAGVYPGPRSTPTLYKARVYFTSPNGQLGCLDQQNGSQLWSVDLEETYGLRGCGFGYSCSPTLVDDLVIVPVGGENAGVVAFDFETGREAWKATGEPASYSPAYPIDLNGVKLVVGYLRNALVILDRTTGEVRCNIKLSTGYDEHSCWPIFSEGKLWLSGPFRAGSYALDLSTLDADAGPPKAAWRSKHLSNDICSSVFVDGHIYGFDILEPQAKTHRPSRGIFRCLDFHTGELKWSNGSGRPRRSSNKDEFKNDICQGGIIVADGKLIVLNELGELVLVEANPRKCVELARSPVLTGELIWTAPCLHNKRLFIRNQSQAMCIYLGEPEELKTTNYIRAADVPQSDYQNLAAMVLAVEPKYMFDVPHDRWLLNWFLAGLAMVVVVNLMTMVNLRRLNTTGRSKKHNWIRLLVVCILGAVGTTAFGHLLNEFVFTWYVCLFAAAEFVVAQTNYVGEQSKLLFIRRRLPLLLFLGVNGIYFLACRRLERIALSCSGIHSF